MMGKAEVIGAADQIHACLKRSEATSSMTRFARQASQPFAKRSIEALDKSGIEGRASLRALEQPLCLLDHPISHVPRDLDDPFFLRALDHRSNVQLRPDLQARSSHSCGSLDLLAEREAYAAWIRAPAIGQHEKGLQGRCASTHLRHQAISQDAITRVLDCAS